MNRSGFTLVELLIVVAIIGTMLASAVLGLASGRQAARMRTATQRAMQLARQAHTMALLKKCPAVITFEEVWDGDSFVGSKVTVESQPEGDTSAFDHVQTLLDGGENAQQNAASGAGDKADDYGRSAAGQDENDPMSYVLDDPEETEDERRGKAPRRPHSFAGIHVRVEMQDEDDDRPSNAPRNRISVFSNVSYLRSTVQKARSELASAAGSQAGEEEDVEDDGAPQASSASAPEPVSVAYEPNGNCVPYRIFLWKNGKSEYDGLTISVSKFGKPVVEDSEDNGTSRRRGGKSRRIR